VTHVQVTYLGVKSNGLVDLAELEAAVRPGQTCLVSVMGVNNEIGVIQPLKEISAVSNAMLPALAVTSLSCYCLH
jgi:cysteine desulfurase